MRTLTFRPAFVVTSVLAVTFLVSGDCAAQSDTEEALVKVNGEVFTRTDLANRELWNYRQLAATSLPQTIVDVVNLMVLEQRGKKQGMTMTDQLFQDLIATQMKFNHLDTEAQWRGAFTEERMAPWLSSGARRNAK